MRQMNAMQIMTSKPKKSTYFTLRFNTENSIMKNLFVLFTVLAISTITIAQTTVNFEIIHKLHGEDFAYNQETFSDMGITFDADRLEYYISEISVEHDGGEITEFDDVWILVSAGANTNVQLGTDTIDSIESISFHIGVDQAHNHLDPTQYSSSHPLSLGNPSMHWGWTAGYRFVAIEGNIGADLANNYQFHALGDGNYFQTSVPANAKAQNGAATVQIYANYAHALNNLDIADGFQLHSEIGECITVLENFRDDVFSMEPPADTILPEVIDTTDSTDVTGLAFIRENQVRLFPNPAQDFVRVDFLESSTDVSIELVSSQGVVVYQSQEVGPSMLIPVNTFPNGLYYLQLSSESSGQVLNKPIMVLH